MRLTSLFGKKKNSPTPAVQAEETEAEFSRVAEMEYRYRMGEAEVRYALEMKDGCSYARVRLEGESADDAVTVPVSEDVVEELSELFGTYDVMRWDGFHESERGVLSGDRFSLSVSFADGNGISADGYMSFPDSFDEVSEGLSEIFRRVRDTAVQS